jgi:hypothetical protein
MGNMLIAPVADAGERASSTTFIHAHTGSSPQVDRRIAITDVVTKDASGNVATSGAFTTTGVFFSCGGSGTGTGGNFRSVHDGGVLQWVAGILGSTGARDYSIFNAIAGREDLAINTAGDIIVGGLLRSSGDNATNLGAASNRWSVVFAGTGTINTSDEREKTDIGEIPEAWLDAWADVEWGRFKFVDRVRWHIGLVAQQVHAAFAAHDIDAFEIGLCCYDEWEEEREPIFESVTKTRKTLTTQYVEAGVNENGQTLFIAQDVEIDEEYQESVDTGKTKVTKPAGDRWGLRENECQAIEAAYKRRELSRMESRLALLEGPKS